MKQDWQVRIIQLLSVAGLLVAFYLLLFHNGLLVAGCTDTGWDDCGAVSGPGAPYASIGPVPVALIGLMGYAVIFWVSWLKDWQPLREYLPEILLGLTGVAFAFTLFLTGLELVVIHAFCRYCLVSAGLVTIMLILSISYLQSPGDEVTYAA